MKVGETSPEAPHAHLDVTSQSEAVPWNAVDFVGVPGS